jgi:hypothetical protein
MTEEQEMFCYWIEQSTEKTIEEIAEDLEITVDYFIQEFLC